MKVSRVIGALGAVAALACSDAPFDPVAGICQRAEPLALRAGEVVEPPGLVGEGICLESGSRGDYVVAVSIASWSPANPARDVDVLGSGFLLGLDDVVAVPPPSASSLGVGPARASSLAEVEAEVVHAGLRRRELEELGPRISAWTGAPATSPVRAAAALPAVGDAVEYPTAVSCSAPLNLRRGRVAAVTDLSIVLIDEDAPQPTYSDAALADFGATFDDTIYPTLTGVFGAPSDIDGNGRVVIFFTHAANALTPPGATSVVGGYFWGGDLFPAAAVPGSRLDACAASAEAEIIYMSVPDPAGTVGTPIDADRLTPWVVLGHELQHLLNASRRIHVNQVEKLEETWLNEGLSAISEELLFFATSGVTPGQDLDESALENLDIVDEFNRFAYGNIGRYNVFIRAPHLHTLLGSDGIETRGAAWSYLRYLLDRSDAPDVVLRQLVNSPLSGLQNIQAATGFDPMEHAAEWAVSLVADELQYADERFQQASWNLKRIIGAIRIDGRYPLSVVGVPPDQGVRFSLRAGGAGFGSLSLEAGSQALVRVAPVDSGASVRAFVVRIR